MGDIDVLRQEVDQYRIVDDNIKRLNRELANAREQRSLIEDRLGVLLETPQFAQFERLSVTADNSVIKIRRPQQWDKPWSLSRSQLSILLDSYFNSTREPTSNECLQYIVQRNKKTSSVFALERVIPE